MVKDDEANIARKESLDSRVAWLIKLPQPPGLIALQDKLLEKKPALQFNLENLTKLGLPSPVEIGDVFRDSRFNPTHRDLQLWENRTRLVCLYGHEWWLGKGFLEDASNQFYLATLADKSFQRTQEKDYKQSGIISAKEYKDLFELVRFRMDTVFSLNGAYPAREDERIKNLTGATLYIYSQLPSVPSLSKML